MFTGLIEEVGEVRSCSGSGGGMILAIAAPMISDELKLGDSVAVNGVCLTADEMRLGGFGCRVMPETARKTTLGRLRPGHKVNLERALAAGGRMGGHMVLGHVDGVGQVVSMRPEGNATLITVRATPEVTPCLAPRGSVAVDGVSLTLARLSGNEFTVSLVQHTLEHTTLRHRGPGDRVNLEADIIGKYVRSMLDAYMQRQGGLTEERLRQGGWLT